MKLLDDGAQAAIRDYVAGTGTLVALRGIAEHRAHYEAFFAAFDVLAVDLLHRVVQEWYLFHEIRMTVQLRTGPDAGAQRSFRVAEFVIPTADARMMVRIGHGTDWPEPARAADPDGAGPPAGGMRDRTATVCAVCGLGR